MTRQENQEALDRRGFLKALAVTGIAATATGGGAALWLNRAEEAPSLTVMTPPAAAGAPSVSAIGEAVTPDTKAPDLLARLASAEAENLRLQAELDATRRQLAALDSANGDSAQLNETLQLELASANNRVSLLAGLIALYEQLDGVDITETIDAGLDTFGAAIGELVDDLPRLENGVARGEEALNNLEAQIPQVREGRVWLDDHLARLQPLYEEAEAVLRSAVEKAGTFLQMVHDWFQGVLKWLPFGAGDRAATVMESLAGLLDETPNTIQGLQRNLAEPLDVWLAGDGEETRLQSHLVKPLKEEALQPAQDVAARVRAQKALYEEKVLEPAKESADSKRLVREQIADYRRKYEI